MNYGSIKHDIKIVSDEEDIIELPTMEGDQEEELIELFAWTPWKILQSICVFVLAGFAEILGGWLVWVAIRERDRIKKPPLLYALLGSLILIGYGFIPCLQPTDSFGRIYAVYGGFFIVLSFFFGWFLDGDVPDLGDVIGGFIALFGVCIVMFWPR